jgi:hypothetical protein
MGADVHSTRAKRKEEREAKRESRDVVKRTIFKRQLLEYVQTIEIIEHKCPNRQADRRALFKASKMMTGLKRVILVPESEPP